MLMKALCTTKLTHGKVESWSKFCYDSQLFFWESYSSKSEKYDYMWTDIGDQPKEKNLNGTETKSDNNEIFHGFVIDFLNSTLQ